MTQSISVVLRAVVAVLCYTRHRPFIHHVTTPSPRQHVGIPGLPQSRTHLVESVFLILTFPLDGNSIGCAAKGELLKPRMGAPRSAGSTGLRSRHKALSAPAADIRASRHGS